MSAAELLLLVLVVASLVGVVLQYLLYLAEVYTFRSPPFALRPKVLVGDTLAVSFDPRQTNRYQMHL